MPVRQYKPTSPGRRGMSGYTFEEITAKEPEKSLTQPLKKHAGRNAQGRITVRHRGGGHKRLYRIIDWKRNKFGIPAVVRTIEYDPNRSARIALVEYADGEKRYILAPEGLRVGQQIMSGPGAEIQTGNALPLRDIPVGTIIHNVELYPGRGGSSCGARAPARSCWRRKAPGRRSGCPRARCGAFTSPAWRPSARSGMRSTPPSGSARPAATAGAGAGRTCAARR